MGGQGFPCLRHHFDPRCLSALLTTWSTAIPKELHSLYFMKSIKYFQLLNGRLQVASCSQTTLDTDSSLVDLSKTMSLLLQCTLYPPLETELEQQNFDLHCSGAVEMLVRQWKFPVEYSIEIMIYLYYRNNGCLSGEQDGLKNRWVKEILVLPCCGKQSSDAVTASCISATVCLNHPQHASEELCSQQQQASPRSLCAPGTAISSKATLKGSVASSSSSFNLQGWCWEVSGGWLTMFMVLWSCRAALWSEALILAKKRLQRKEYTGQRGY